MRPDQVALWLGKPRFRAYLEASGEDHDRAVALYNWNAEISAAFMEVLCHLEVLLRNAIDRQFPISEPDRLASIVRADIWLSDPAILTVESREKVNNAIARLERVRKAPTRGRVIASLSFGFWQGLFASPYEDLWRTTLSAAFPNGNGKRRQIGGLVGPILHFRNRIAHHEAVFSSNLEARHDQILELAGIIDEEARSNIAALSRVRKLLLERP